MNKKITAVMGLFLAVALLLLMAACSKKNQEVAPEPVLTVSPSRFFNLLPFPEGPDQSAMKLDMGYGEKLEKSYQENQHAAAWIAVDTTSIDDVVMYAPEEADPFFYLRRSSDKQDLFEGTYFIDSLSDFDGSRSGMSKNIIIYGHSMSDDPNGEQFSQFKKLHDPKWAKENPYIYFSAREEEMAWEIFAAFDTHVSFIYNIPNPTDEKYQEILEGARKRSIYDYNVEVTPEDKIITISTCIYNYNGTSLLYPNDYRFVIMAIQVPMGEKLKEEAEFAINENVFIDR